VLIGQTNRLFEENSIRRRLDSAPTGYGSATTGGAAYGVGGSTIGGGSPGAGASGANNAAGR
jgi:hypothetical protein